MGCLLEEGGRWRKCLPLRNQRGQILSLGTLNLNNGCKVRAKLEAIHRRARVVWDYTALLGV